MKIKEENYSGLMWILDQWGFTGTTQKIVIETETKWQSKCLVPYCCSCTASANSQKAGWPMLI